MYLLYSSFINAQIKKYFAFTLTCKKLSIFHIKDYRVINLQRNYADIKLPIPLHKRQVNMSN